MKSLIDIQFLHLVATLFLGGVGLAFTLMQARAARRQNTLNLYERWDAEELSRYRSHAWDAWKDLVDRGDEAVVRWLGGDYFGKTVAEIDEVVPEQRTHAVRSLLNYFARVYEYQRLGLTDRKVTAELFREPWLWWGPFFTLLRGRVEGHLRATGLPEGEWAARSFITSLDRVVALDLVIRPR